MRRRILVCEQADAVRSVAETVLRQNGFEVISVADVSRAREVLDFSRPDLIIAGADLKSNDQTFFYEALQQDNNTSSIPLLVIAPMGGGDVGLPPEVVIPRPFDPKDFISRVNVFVGKGESPGPTSQQPAATPLGTLDDDFLDAALGIDSLDVTDSEVMDTTTGARIQPSSTSGIKRNADSGRVESLMIRDEDAEIQHSEKKKQTEQPSESGKLDIMSDSDQYGLHNLEAGEGADSDKEHDYDWFIESMREEVGAKPSEAKKPEVTPDDQELQFTATSASVDPVTPGPSKSPSQKGAAGGVEKFIDEFKKEIAQLQDEQTDAPIDTITQSAGEDAISGHDWEEVVEKLSDENISQFLNKLAEVIGAQIADKIISKLDSDKLLALIRSELVARVKQSQ